MNTIVRICNEIHPVSGLEGCPLAEIIFQQYILLSKNKNFRMVIFSRPFSRKTLEKRRVKSSYEVLESLLHDKYWYGNVTNREIIKNLKNDIHFVDFNLIEKICYFFVRKSIFKRAFYALLSISYHARIAFRLRRMNIKNAVIHLFNRPLALLFRILTRDYKYVLEMGNSHLVQKNRFFQKLVNLSVSSFDSIIFVSKFLKKEYKTRNRKAPKQHIVYIGLSTLYLDLINNLRAVIKKPIKISGWKAQFFNRQSIFKVDNNIRILFIGRIVPQKGIDVLLNALGSFINDKKVQDILHQNKSQIELIIVGAPLYGKKSSSPYLRDVKQKIQEFTGDYFSITFKGFLDRVKLVQEYISSDILVVPSTWDEPYGLVNLEGMFFYDIDIASKIGGIPEIISHSGEGYLFQKGNSTELAGLLNSAVRKILNNDPSLKRLAENAHRKIEQKCSMENYLETLLRIYEDTIRH